MTPLNQKFPTSSTKPEQRAIVGINHKIKLTRDGNHQFVGHTMQVSDVRLWFIAVQSLIGKLSWGYSRYRIGECRDGKTTKIM